MIWRNVIEYEGLYEVSTTGKVRSMDRNITDSIGRIRKMKGKELAQHPDTYGYFTVSLSRGSHKTRRVHQLVCEAFLGPRPEGKEILHGISGHKDNNISNLRYGSKSQNARDRMRDGTQHNNSRKIIRSDGVVFPSATSASESCRTSIGNIVSVCRKRRRLAGGFSWSYYKEMI
jgi:hypothetical protein